jgi:hypothetical protein
MSSGSLAVSVYKVPRRSEDELIEICDREHIRVNPRGRPLVVRVSWTDSTSPVDWSTLRLSLFNMNTSVAVDESKTSSDSLWMRKPIKKSIPPQTDLVSFVAVSVRARSDWFAFRATARSVGGSEATGLSASFYASDSGQSRAERKQKALQAAKVGKQEETSAIPGSLEVLGRVVAKDCIRFPFANQPAAHHSNF